MNTPKLRIRVPDGRTVLTTVELDGKQVPATRVRFDSGESMDGLVLVEMTFLADIEMDVENVPVAVTGIRRVPGSEDDE